MKATSEQLEITVLPGLEAVRRRPERFVGPLDDPLLPNLLLLEALCCARDEALRGRCSRVQLTLNADGCASVVDNGPGMSLALDEGGKRIAEIELTELQACARAKSCETVAASTCTFGLAVLNALSSRLALQISADGSEWHQDYSCGVACNPLQVSGPTSACGTRIDFVLDARILPNPQFQFEALVRVIEASVRALEVIIADTRTGQSVRLPAR